MSHKTKADRQREAKNRQYRSDLMKEIAKNTDNLLDAVDREQARQEFGPEDTSSWNEWHPDYDRKAFEERTRGGNK